MLVITLQDDDGSLGSRLRTSAAAYGRTLEEEAREILQSALPDAAATPGNLARRIRERLAPFGGLELDIPPRTDFGRDPPTFE